jgi:hypothetical protein
MQHPAEALLGEPVHVGGDMPEDPVAEVAGSYRYDELTP